MLHAPRNKSALPLAAALGLTLLGGCAAITTPAGVGLIYTDVTSPTTVVTPEMPRQMKRGEACSKNILGWVTTGDSSIVTAALDGDISHIRIVEQRSTGVLGVTATHCTIVWGD